MSLPKKKLWTLTLYRRALQVGVFLFFFLVYYTSHKQSFFLGTFYSFKIGPIHIVDPYIYLTYFFRNLPTPKIYLDTLIGFLIPVLLAFFLGRVFCSWVCPYNFFYEVLNSLKVRLFKRHEIHYFCPHTSKHRFGILLILLIAGAVFPFLAYLVVLPGLLSTFLHQIILRAMNFLSFTLLFLGVIFVLDFFFKKRIWCNLLCPTGILLQLFSWRRGLRVEKIDEERCGQCALCSFSCPLGLTPHLNNHQDLCFNCGKCVEICERLRMKDPPLRFKFF